MEQLAILATRKKKTVNRLTKSSKILKTIISAIKEKKGEVIAIVGPTGAGKTTIVNLLTMFYKIDSGESLIDGKNIEEHNLHLLRRNCGVAGKPGGQQRTQTSA